MSWKTSLIIVLAVVVLGGIIPAFAWEVRLGWDDPNNDSTLVAGYNLYSRRPELGEISYTNPPMNVGNNLTFLVTNLQNGFYYCFIVTAYGLNPESGYSNELCVNSSLNIKPVASIEQPIAESTVSGVQLVQVRVVDSDDTQGSHNVTLDINNIGNWVQMIYNAVSQLYERVWDTGPFISQVVDLIAIAVDSGGWVSEPAVITVTIVGPPSADTTIAFDNPAPPGSSGSLFSGIFQGIDFGADQWRWEGAFGPDPTNHIFFDSSTGTSRTFTFSPAPQLLVSMAVFTGQNGTLTLTDNNGQTVSQNITTGSMQTVTTGWIQGSIIVTVNFTTGWDFGVDDIVYRDVNTYSLFSLSSVPGTPAEADSNAVELGVRFTSDINAWIIGIRFYKDITNTGPHIGNLWTDDGQLLGSVLFTNETSDGWQEVLFVSSIPITAGTVYVVSYHTPSGNYAVDENYFMAPFDNPPLHAPADINGVYQYGSGGVFPSSTFNASNYWVDVVMEVP